MEEYFALIVRQSEIDSALAQLNMRILDLEGKGDSNELTEARDEREKLEQEFQQVRARVLSLGAQYAVNDVRSPAEALGDEVAKRIPPP